MQLQWIAPSQLYFPVQEWKILRGEQSLTAAPDFFLWGYQPSSEGKTWCWTSKGKALAPLPFIEKIPVLLLQPSSDLEAFGLYLKISFQSSPALDVEWVSAIDVLKMNFHYAIEEQGLPPYWKEALEASHLSPHAGALVQRAKYLFLSPIERQFLFDKRWDLATFELIEILELSLRQQILTTIQKWNFSAQQSKEIISWSIQLQKKIGGLSVGKLLIQDYENADELRSRLQMIAQPEFAQLTQKRIELLRSLKVPQRTSVYGDPNFEKDLLRITHTPRNLADFEIFKNWVIDAQTKEKIFTLLEFYQ